MSKKKYPIVFKQLNYYIMRPISIFVISFLLLNTIVAQQIGIGTSNPQATLHVAGTTRTDDLLIKMNTGSSILGELKVSASETSIEQNNGGAIWGTSASGWQSFTANEDGLLMNVEMFFAAPQNLSQLNIYQGEGTGGTLLKSVALSNVTGFDEWIISPPLNVTLQQNTMYTIWLDNIQHWEWASGNPYTGGKSTINDFIDFKFKVNTVQNITPFKVEGDGIASFSLPHPGSTLAVNGAISTASIQIAEGAMEGYILTSDSTGSAAWMPPQTNNTFWSASSNHIYNTNSGNVGIGTSSPNAKLQLAGTSGTLLRIGATSGFHGNTTLFSFAGDGAFAIDAPNVPAGRFFVHGTSGNIGIGNPSPSEKLDITGNIKLSGFIGNESPIDVTFQSNWTNGIEVYIGGPVRYYKDKEKRVHLSGGAEKQVGAGNIIFILPTGYRPSDTVFVNGAGGPDLAYRIAIHPDGDVEVFGNNLAWVSLDNISFRVN